jgi:hypothetical protein
LAISVSNCGFQRHVLPALRTASRCYRGFVR